MVQAAFVQLGWVNIEQSFGTVKDILLTAVQQNGEALRFASEAMRDDKELESLLSQADPVRTGKNRIPEQSLKHLSGRP